LHIILPLRPYIYSYISQNDPDWLNEGYHFSWRESTNFEDVLLRYDVQIDDDERISVVPSFELKGIRLNNAQLDRLRRDPDLLKQFIEKFIKPYYRITDQEITSIIIDSWKSLNGRPYQRFINPSIDFLNENYSVLDGHSKWILPQIPEVNTLPWLQYLEAVRDQWADQRSEVMFFADLPGYEFQAKFRQVTVFLALVLLKGEIILDIDKKPIRSPAIGEYVEIPWETWHTIKTIGNQPSCWVYLYSFPSSKPFRYSINM